MLALSFLAEPTPLLRVLAGQGLAAVGWSRGGEGRVEPRQAVWKESPATSSLSQPIEQQSKSPSEFLSGAYPASPRHRATGWRRWAPPLHPQPTARKAGLGKARQGEGERTADSPVPRRTSAS